MLRSKATVGPIIALILTSACFSDRIASGPEISTNSTVQRSSLSGNLPTLFPNSRRFTDRGGKAAVGRSGSASLSALALIGRLGPATLDVAAGDASGAVAGQLARIQVKQYAPNGVATRTFSAVGGPTTQLMLNTREHGARVQVQANITGINGTRVDVVTVEETIKYRPDPAVVTIDHASRTVIGAQTLIGGGFQELKGDMAASADCILSIDGVDVDRATGTWIAPGFMSSCVFAHRFTTTGSHAITVRLENVTPADYDVSNNQRSSSIEVDEPAPVETHNDFTWDAAIDGAMNQSGTEHSVGWWQYLPTGERADYDNTINFISLNRMGANVNGRTSRALVGPVDVSFKDWVDETVLHDDAFNPVSDVHLPFELGRLRQNCSYLLRTHEFQGEEGPYVGQTGFLFVCSNRNVDPDEELETWFTYYADQGDVTYYADNWAYYVSPEFSHTYSFNGTLHNAWGNFTSGANYRFEMTFSAGGESLVASGKFPILREDIHDASPFSCSDYDDGAYSQHQCASWDYTYTRLSGYGFGTPHP